MGPVLFLWNTARQNLLLESGEEKGRASRRTRQVQEERMPNSTSKDGIQEVGRTWVQKTHM